MGEVPDLPGVGDSGVCDKRFSLTRRIKYGQAPTLSRGYRVSPVRRGSGMSMGAGWRFTLTKVCLRSTGCSITAAYAGNPHVQGFAAGFSLTPTLSLRESGVNISAGRGDLLKDPHGRVFCGFSPQGVFGEVPDRGPGRRGEGAGELGVVGGIAAPCPAPWVPGFSGTTKAVVGLPVGCGWLVERGAMSPPAPPWVPDRSPANRRLGVGRTAGEVEGVREDDGVTAGDRLRSLGFARDDMLGAWG